LGIHDKHSVIPEKSGIQNYPVIPAKAEIQYYRVIPAKAGIQRGEKGGGFWPEFTLQPKGQNDTGK
jgi:hypothetical protein